MGLSRTRAVPRRAALGIMGRAYRAAGVITGAGDTDITTITSLSEALAAKKPGEKTKVTYTRDGAEKTVDVTLGEQ